MEVARGERSRVAKVEAAPKLSLVIPTLNEAGNIERILRRLDEVLCQSGHSDYEVIVVDDDSKDGTGTIADRIAADLPDRFRVIHRTGKASLGMAAVAGWQASKGDVLGLMDADFQHPPELIPRLLDAIQAGADIAIGSRYAKGGGMSEQWSLLRKLASMCSTGFTRLLLRKALRDVHDPFSGCFAMRRQVIEGKRLNPEGFKVLVEVLVIGNYGRVLEVPYQFSPRSAGQSKLRLRVAIDDFLLLVRLARQARRRL